MRGSGWVGDSRGVRGWGWSGLGWVGVTGESRANRRGCAVSREKRRGRYRCHFASEGGASPLSSSRTIHGSSSHYIPVGSKNPLTWGSPIPPYKFTYYLSTIAACETTMSCHGSWLTLVIIQPGHCLTRIDTSTGWILTYKLELNAMIAHTYLHTLIYKYEHNLAAGTRSSQQAYERCHGSG
eukprot:COSAG02_NODE_635_length_19251_cov_32.350982_16_plen_182_part_00